MENVSRSKWSKGLICAGLLLIAAALLLTGYNLWDEQRAGETASRVLEQMRDPMILVLLGAAVLSLVASGGEDWLDGVIIFIIVAVNAVISIHQEDHAQQALEELRKMSSPQARVLRDGRPGKVPAAALVHSALPTPAG